MIFRSPQNPHSHLTVKDRQGPSFPVKYLLQKGLIRGDVLDFGCGTGVDVSFLQNKGFSVKGYDPYYKPKYPEGKFDTILCFYVLNVLLPEEQCVVLMAVSELLKPNGKAFFAVRRDIKQSGYRIHVKHGVPVFQCDVLLPYRSILRVPHCEIYEYQHWNQQSQSKGSCPFCCPKPEQELITESATAYALLDSYPVSPGHALIIPKQHIQDYFELPERIKTACWMVVGRVKWLLDSRYHPEGYNVGVNVGTAGGQTIPHAHIHIIPRYTGDVENPRGGIRNMIPGKGDYTNKL